MAGEAGDGRFEDFRAGSEKEYVNAVTGVKEV